MKIHLSFAASDLERSVEFYSTLLDARPVKVLPDYALFVTTRPGLELALNLDGAPKVAQDTHFGICVESAEDVDRAIARLESAGLVSSIERDETCCYANQTKVWAEDPEGRRWEVYTVHDETVERDGEPSECCPA